MINKKLLFCSLSALLQIIGSHYSYAVDMIRAEDEYILMDVGGGQTLKDDLNVMTEQEYYNGANNIVVQRTEPSLGVPVQSIKVPDEVNARAAIYDDPEIIKVHPDTPRSLYYPIGQERAKARESLKEPFNPFLKVYSTSPEVMSAHQARLDIFKANIDNCMAMHQANLSVEMDMLYNGSLYDNASYLSQTMEEIEQCYDNIGLEIIDTFYTQDNEALREYNQRSAEFHVNSSSINFNPKFCGENCSMEAVANLQLEKFDEFKSYLYQLLNKAPIAPINADDNLIPPLIDTDEFENPSYRAQNNREVSRGRQNDFSEAAPKAAPKALRVRTPDGQVKVIRLNADNEYEEVNDMPMDDIPEAVTVQPVRVNRQNQYNSVAEPVATAPIRLDYDGVPLIDEDDLL